MSDWRTVLLESYSQDEVARAAQRLRDLETELLDRRAELCRAEDALEAVKAGVHDPATEPAVRPLLVSEMQMRYHAVEQLRGKAATAERRLEEVRLYLYRATEANRVLQWQRVR